MKQRKLFARILSALLIWASGALIASPVAATVIDVMVLYDTAGKAWVDNNGGMTTFSQDVINKMNQALMNSGVAELTFNLAHSAAVPYTTQGFSADLNNLFNGSGSLSDVAALRDQYGADLVAMLIDTGSSTGSVGQGFLLTVPGGFDKVAYTVTAIQAVALDHTLTHEVGHNLGLGHSASQSSSPGPNAAIAPYAAGWYFAGSDNVNYSTIMGYNWDEQGNYFEMAPLFSTPLVLYQGTAAGDPEVADNVRALKITMAAVSAYRQQPALTGVTISGPASVNENSSATYTATASWSSGATSTITPSWSENSSYASINNDGLLTTLSVPNDQTITLTAIYLSDGMTKTDTHEVRILDVPDALIIKGDVAPFGSRDGVINVGDALVCLRFALGLETPTAEDILHADVAPLDSEGKPAPDGIVNVGDALVILRKAVGLIEF